ncbi:MAG: hypothetical protein HYU02_03645 [Thaumarchaeota archaeon]|nr:hypothetical protein [Nitrososphaerota archaeon]
MLTAISFRAKPGGEREFEQMLNNPEAGRNIAKAMGAIRNTLFLKEGRMFRIMEFPEGVKPMSLIGLAQRDPKVKEFLRKMGSIIEDGFDVDNPESVEAFNRRNSLNLAYDVKL